MSKFPSIFQVTEEFEKFTDCSPYAMDKDYYDINKTVHQVRFRWLHIPRVDVWNTFTLLNFIIYS